MMKAKFIKNFLFEKFTEDSDPIRDMGIGQQPDQKDVKRLEDIKSKANGSNWKEEVLAETMANRITDKQKAYRRYLAAVKVGGKSWTVCSVFLRRAVELGHEQAIEINNEIEAERERKRQEKLKEKRDLTMPFAEKFVKQLNKSFGLDAGVSTMCSYPYWNNEGLFVNIPYVEGANYSGYTSGGPTHVTDNRKTYLGNTMFKIASLARRHNVSLYKDHNNYFVKFPFSEFAKK